MAAVPHSDASAYHYMVSVPLMHPLPALIFDQKVNITVEYVTTSEPDITRVLRLSRVVATSLPVAINVEDFFRGTRLFTAFTLSTTSHQHVRVRATQLLSQGESDSVKITNCMASKPSVVVCPIAVADILLVLTGPQTITPAQPGRFLFQLDSVKGQGTSSVHST